MHQLPLPESEGKAIRIAHEPVEIPIYLATLGPKSLEYTGKAANGWLGTSFSPDHPEAHMDFLPQAQPRLDAVSTWIAACPCGWRSATTWTP